MPFQEAPDFFTILHYCPYFQSKYLWSAPGYQKRFRIFARKCFISDFKSIRSGLVRSDHTIYSINKLKNKLIIITLLFVVTVFLSAVPAEAQTLDYKLETDAGISHGTTPLWLNANKYGVSSLDESNGYLRTEVYKSLKGFLNEEIKSEGRGNGETSESKWDWGAGLDIVVPHHYTSDIIIQQAYVEGRWLHGILTIGAKEFPEEQKNPLLSSGSQTLGINARPIPQIRLELPDYIKVFNWLGFKGHIAYGWATDTKWQERTADPESKWAKNMLLHTKSGFLRFGHPSSHFTFETGIEMACQFGGTTYNHGKAIKRGTKLKDYWQAFLPGGDGDVGEGVYANVEGNGLGSLMSRFNLDEPTWKASFYIDHFFDDHSQLFFLDFDGYGDTDNDFRKHKYTRYIFYTPRDGLFGWEVNLKRGTWLKDIVLEYLHTTDQSGSVYHDSEPGLAAHVAGRDDYYNHYFYPGWQHWGQSMGNPLYRSPVYNDDGIIDFKDTRFIAWHLGFSGTPIPLLDYRILATFQKGWGTYNNPYVPIERNFSMLMEAAYQLHHGWRVKGAFGLDHGKILGNNVGFNLTISKSGIFKL